MLAFLQQNYMAVLIIGGILAIVLFAICIIWKFVRLAIGIAILSIIIPILFTIFLGRWLGVHFRTCILSNAKPPTAVGGCVRLL